MQIDRYRFKLGDFECLAIRDVTATGGDAGWFPNIPSEVSHPILQKQNINPDSFDHTMTCLAVNTGTDWVLLDTGMGFVRGDWMREDPKLKQILEEENIQPRHIILTHLDLDHYAGLINTDNTPAFPNADVHICRDAWELFTSSTFYEGNDTYDRREHLFLVEDQIRLIECAGEVLPGFSMVSFPGHREHHHQTCSDDIGKWLSGSALSLRFSRLGTHFSRW